MLSVCPSPDSMATNDTLNTEKVTLSTPGRCSLANINTQHVVCVQWEKYRRCDGTPDPAVQQDINTYMSLWRDDPEVDITVVLKQCNLALQVSISCGEVDVPHSSVSEGSKVKF